MKRVVLAAALMAFSVSGFARDITKPLNAETQAALTPTEVVQLMKDGNKRFLDDKPLERNFAEQIKASAGGQYPMATVLGCIDSRVPHEIVFDKGVGDIFSARVAGNFINSDILGSLEFATAVAGSKVIVVLGHTECGAVKGACDNIQMGNLTSTLSNIAPAVYSVGHKHEVKTSKNKAFVNDVAHANVDLTVRNIADRSPIIRDLIANGKLIVIGAMHNVSTGKIEFFDDKKLDHKSI
ncbi:carbonic anhydrase [Paraperlucidibaca baekdonensis]|uniref:Carbonic anhydrase n=1 Tax=Paraperlucidibaca baekdonensis TaxID=748120 RepID=A0A3E0H6N1_9GAMM|nr:carbonic anhydrase family protein [Paraperlucidibaca baekdonensis]REH39122.1 carbonic anhydrase [Paraperlucidibaca baekdonensis]